ncbi:MAG: hypothetical protein EPO13_00280 [Actinomycetota bacterium]|nr:MAG: hypothetical protein EPO13_00280 [Actinomycetota bacterium]
MSALRAALDEWSGLWTGLGSPPPETLMRPGLSIEEIRARLSESSLAPCDDVVDWFSWHDGSALSTWRLPGSALVGVSLAEALRRRERQWAVSSDLASDGMFDDSGGVESLYRRQWLPLARPVGSGGDLVVVLDRQVAHPAVKRLDWADGYGPVHDIAGSLADVVGHWIRVLRTGLVRFSAETNRWERDTGGLPADLHNSDLIN